MTNNPTPNRTATSTKWAPWWVYLIVLLGANYLRAYLMPAGTLPEPVIVAIALVQAAVLFVIVTAIWRETRRDKL